MHHTPLSMYHWYSSQPEKTRLNSYNFFQIDEMIIDYDNNQCLTSNAAMSVANAASTTRQKSSPTHNQE